MSLALKDDLRRLVRKIDLKVYQTYPELLKALEFMFKCTIGYNGSEYAPTYEDKDSDWMLVGDVPWEMFITSCKRMRIMRASEAKGLGCTISHVYTVATVLRCLSQAPRLPALDWGAIIRRCMKYEGQIAESLSPDLACKSGILREECLQLSLAHANQFDPLLSFLDELSDLSRFRTLELNLQSWFLSHLADLIKIFSGSRLEKLFDDVANFIASLLSGEVCTVEQKSLLRASCWNGLYPCMETSLDTREYVSNMENCMEVLFFSLPVLHSDAIPRMEQLHSVEWSAAVRCLAKARQGWLFTLLQVSEANLVEGDGEFSKVVKTMQAKAKLVQIGSIPPSELGKLKAYLLNTRSDG
ncbi:hypothetical protein TEA_020206 [Camellia sinensis var. sinensis]|uniref:Auxin-responsive protein n=1 Tax=Camellia sinensis var. sinensis TaxID=542762 RepID=A0A4V3WML9_CAMSN|nr:hypothetical protein TEA_020206 [Camellia sinensis var. sinensis]